MAEKFSLGMEPLSPFVSTPVDASPLSSVAELSSQWQGPVNTQSYVIYQQSKMYFTNGVPKSGRARASGILNVSISLSYSRGISILTLQSIFYSNRH